ncbi:MAG: NTP transferase domain-containing protein [Candidatus Bathyarchaeia archaeon]
MKIPALIMAGGKGTRMGLETEKPLLPFLGKPLLDWVVDAVKSAEQIAEFHVVTSKNTPETEKRCAEAGLKVIRTDGKNYHHDLRQAIIETQLKGSVLTMPADLPAVTGKFLDKVITTYKACGKDALAVFVPIAAREKLGLSVSSIDEHQGVWYAVAGINIINSARIKEGKIETSAIITEEIDVLLNINTLQDLKIAEQILQKRLSNMNNVH